MVTPLATVAPPKDVISVKRIGFPAKPAAFSWVLPFRQTVGGVADAETLTVNATVAVVVASDEHPKAVVPVTVYVFVTVVDEITVEPVVTFRFVDGLQV